MRQIWWAFCARTSLNNLVKVIFVVGLAAIIVQGCVINKNINKSINVSKVIEISSMAELESFVRPDSLVLFDLDNTLLESAQVYGHVNWLYDQIEEGKSRGISHDETIKRTFAVWLRSQERNRVKPVEALTPALIKRLQNRGLKVMGLTARQTPLIPATLRQLSDLGVDFGPSSLAPATFDLTKFVAPVAFNQGVLFVSEFIKKSHVLTAYLDRIGYVPRHIVFVDDSKKHVQDLVEAFNARGIGIVGLHYPLVASRPHFWDRLAAAKIFEKCDKEGTQTDTLCGKSPLLSSGPVNLVH